ncbi:MAG: calcium/sodium antiporter [Oscillospiraceae bacterium]|nr:calcium/sodium antiporter [Oscillospiraceae bacterium]
MFKMLEVLLLILGFILLIKGADAFVNSSVGIAKRFKIPSVIIGLTVVAFGTSAPEMVVSITASVRGSNALAISNVIGSNIVNLLFVVGLCAMIKSMRVKIHELAKDFWFSILAAALLLGIRFFSGETFPRMGSAALLVIFIIYMVILIRQTLKSKNPEITESGEEAKKQRPLPVIILLTVLGCAAVVAGGQLAVDSAVKIAAAIGISERIIGLTIVAIGTSLPELATSLVACKKCETDIALGNVIGSNIFNLLLVLGSAGVISPLVFDKELIFDTVVLIAGSLIVLLFSYTRKRITRGEGTVMVLMYAVYMTFIMWKI